MESKFCSNLYLDKIMNKNVEKIQILTMNLKIQKTIIYMTNINKI